MNKKRFFKKSTTQKAAQSLIDSLSGDKVLSNGDPDFVTEARKLCKSGNPFPLIALQWPEFLVTGDDCKYFEGDDGNAINPCLRFDWWQRLIFSSFFSVQYPEIFVKGCTGPGKGACIAIAINLDFDVCSDVMWNITADTNKHAQEVMFGEIVKWRHRMVHPCAARVLTSAIISNERKFITVLNPEKSTEGESFSGRHGSKYMFDEASSAPDMFYEMAVKNACKIVCSANPRKKTGFFRAAFNGLADENKTGTVMGTLGKRLCVTIGGMDCTNVNQCRIKEQKSPIGGIEIDGVSYPEGDFIPDYHFVKVKALIPGQMDINQYRSILKSANEQWKRQCFAEGKFPDEDPTSQFFMRGWLLLHQSHHKANYLDIQVNSFGLDVARSLAGDDSTLSCGSFQGCRDQYRFKLDRYPDIAERVLKIAMEYGIDLYEGRFPLCIDYGGGYGSGVGDWLSQRGVWIVEQMPGGKAQVVPEVFQNQRTEDYALLAYRMDPARQWGDVPFGIPSDVSLEEEILAVSKVWNSSMTRFGTIPKELMKSSFHDKRSPDSSDSLALMFRGVRALEDLDMVMRSAIVSSELIVSYAGQGNLSNAFGQGEGSRKVSDVIDDLVSFYRKGNQRTW